jgi:hypothetical protein
VQEAHRQAAEGQGIPLDELTDEAPPADTERVTGTDALVPVTVEQYELLVEIGALGKVEMLYGRISCGNFEMVFGAEAARAAARAGIRVRSSVEDVLADAESRAEVAARLTEPTHGE